MSIVRNYLFLTSLDSGKGSLANIAPALAVNKYIMVYLNKKENYHLCSSTEIVVK